VERLLAKGKTCLSEVRLETEAFGQSREFDQANIVSTISHEDTTLRTVGLSNIG